MRGGLHVLQVLHTVPMVPPSQLHTEDSYDSVCPYVDVLLTQTAPPSVCSIRLTRRAAMIAFVHTYVYVVLTRTV